MHHVTRRPRLASTAAIATLVAAPTAFSDPVILVGDLTLNRIYRTADLNADGDTDDAGETTVFFDDTNAEGLLSPAGSVFTIHLASDGSVYYGDGGTDAVYRLQDVNADGDALDLGESRVWFSEAANFAGFGLPTPNGVYEGPDGAIYISNAGTGANPSDAVYRTVDLNADGDANDVGEATIWWDLQALLGGASTAFDVVFMGDTCFIADTLGGDPDTILRARDDNADGSISAAEYNPWLEASLGIPVGTGIVTDGTSIYASESTSSATQTVYRLTDLDASGMIDAAVEAVEVWNEANVPVGFSLGSSFGLAIGPGGELAVGSAGSDPADNVFRLVDGNADGDFADAGETTVWAYESSGPDSFVQNPRALEYLVDPCPEDLSGNGAADFADILAIIAAWGPCVGCPEDLSGNGAVDFADILLVIAAWGPC
jgi:hypothetical protein